MSAYFDKSSLYRGVGIVLLTFCLGCTQTAAPPVISEKVRLDISDCFEEVFSINLDDHDLARFTPSRMRVKGVFGEGDVNYALYDLTLQECLVFNSKKNSVEHTFEIPKNEDWGEAHLLEVVSLDSIRSFDFDHQALVVCSSEEIKQAYDLKMNKEHHQPYQIIQHLHKSLRSIDGYIGFNAWIDYGGGGYDVDYDSLMDERNMVCFFKVEGGSVISRDVPIKPYLRKTTFPDVLDYEVPYFEVNHQRREILAFHCTTDTLYTYGWDDEVITKHVVSGSDVQIVPAKVPRRGSSAEIVAAYEEQEMGFHNLYFDHESGKYVRYLVKRFPKQSTGGIPPGPDIRMLQVLNSNFEVEAEMGLPEGDSFSKRVAEGIYLQKYDNELGELRVMKFTWEQVDA